MSQPEENDERRPLRVLLAVGNPEREHRLRDGLATAGVAIAGRCLDGPTLGTQRRLHSVMAPCPQTTRIL